MSDAARGHEREALDDFGRARWLEALLHGDPSPRWRATHAAFTLAMLAHLWLGDAWHLSWLPANLLQLTGALLVAWRGAALGWWLCALGLLGPLWFLRDQLTQSVLLLFFSTSAGLASALGARRLLAGLAPSPADGARQVWRAVTASTYLLAALHKTNAIYVDARYSCAVYGWDKLLDYWRLPAAPLTPDWWAAALPHTTLVVEAGIGLLLICGRRRLAWPLAIAFHIPLTLTMAPAFALVMLAGHSSFLEPGDLPRLREVLRRRGLAIAIAASALTTISLALHGELPPLDMIPKEWLLWALLLMSLIAFPLRRRATPPEPSSLRARLAALAAMILFWLNGLTPYLGVQYQHTAAMLSNLRIDDGCWNSLVFPERVRLRDEYVRVDAVHFGQPGAIPDYERTVLEHLWSPPQLRQMQRNWCPSTLRPFYLRGTWRGEPFEIEDLCALDTDALPFGGAGIFGVEIFPDYLRYQKNLARECPQACIH